MKKLIYIIIISVLFFSCQKKTTFRINYPEEKIVVNCTVNPDSLCKVYISKSLTPIDTINFKSLKNAKIELYQNGNFAGLLNSFIETNKNPGLGYYFNTGININPGDNLRIKVSHNNFETADSKTTVPEKPNAKITVLSYSFEDIPNPEVTGYDYNALMQLRFIDNHSTEKYYSLNMYYYADCFPYPLDVDTLYKDKIHFSINADNVIATYQFNEGYLFANQYFYEDTTNFILNIEDALYVKRADFNKIFIEIKTVNKDFYFYQKTLKEYYQTLNNPFGEPAKVYCNINNGYGIFAAYSSVIDTIFIE